MAQSVTPAPSEIVLLSGNDLRRLLTPTVVIEALQEAYAALADNPGDQGRSVGFPIDGGSIHVKSGLCRARISHSPQRSTSTFPIIGSCEGCRPSKVRS
jgi:hypothetical protein